MPKRTAVFLLAVLPLLAAKKPAVGQGENESVKLHAKVYTDKELIREVVGSDLDGHYVVVEVQATPRFGKELDVHRDDFLLRTDRDGERSTPFAPSQIAGRGSLVISQRGGGGGGVMADDRGPIWGGYPGSTDRPRRLGGEGSVVGNAGGQAESRADMNTGAKDKDNPLLVTLRDKSLPEKKTAEPVGGLLYFPLGKQKVKDLELIYSSPTGKVSVRFR
jgi:hypothetical protein